MFGFFDSRFGDVCVTVLEMLLVLCAKRLIFYGPKLNLLGVNIDLLITDKVFN